MMSSSGSFGIRGLFDEARFDEVEITDPVPFSGEEVEEVEQIRSVSSLGSFSSNSSLDDQPNTFGNTSLSAGSGSNVQLPVGVSTGIDTTPVLPVQQQVQNWNQIQQPLNQSSAPSFIPSGATSAASLPARTVLSQGDQPAYYSVPQAPLPVLPGPSVSLPAASGSFVSLPPRAALSQGNQPVYYSVPEAPAPPVLPGPSVSLPLASGSVVSLPPTMTLSQGNQLLNTAPITNPGQDWNQAQQDQARRQQEIYLAQAQQAQAQQAFDQLNQFRQSNAGSSFGTNQLFTSGPAFNPRPLTATTSLPGAPGSNAPLPVGALSAGNQPLNTSPITDPREHQKLRDFNKEILGASERFSDAKTLNEAGQIANVIQQKSVKMTDDIVTITRKNSDPSLVITVII